MRRAITPFGLVLALGSCGAQGANGQCTLGLIVETANPEVGRSVVVRVTSSYGGFIDADWSVSFDSNPISCTDDAGGLCEGTSISFIPATAGPYSIAVSGTVSGGSCFGDQATINVTVPGANSALYRMVVTPLDAGAVYEELVSIPGGADYALGERRLAASVPVAGVVLQVGVSLAAHLRFAGTQDGAVRDVFASAADGYDVELPPGEFDVDVYPADPSIAPVRLVDQSAASLGNISFAVGQAVTGVVRGPAATPLSSARVLLTSGSLPSSVGQTSGSGDFSVQTRAPASDIAVSPPTASGLPLLTGAIGAVSSGSTIDVTYSAALVVVSRSFVVTENDGTTPIAFARVSFLSDSMAAAGQVSVDGGAATSLGGRVRVSATADGAGQLPPLDLTNGSYTVVVERGPSDSGPAFVLSRQLAAGVNLTLAAAEVATWTAQILDEDGGPVAAADLSFRPLGALSLARGATRNANSEANGDVTASLIGGASYEVQIDAGDGFGRLVGLAVDAAEAGGSSDAGLIALARAQRVTGVILRQSGAAVAAHVAFYCETCANPLVPVAEVVTAATGGFEIGLPDSGAN